MDAKNTWPVVKFLIAATGFKRRDARKLLEEIPEEHFSRLFVSARAWDRDQAAKASEQFQTIIGSENLPTLLQATRLAQTPAAAGGDDSEETETRKPRKKQRR